jgi:xylulose-5-phosphate/fructose-6-phosphate phosphoketolase
VVTAAARQHPDSGGAGSNRPAAGTLPGYQDPFKLQPGSEHPHGLSDRDFDSLFTTDKPIIFNFHGYPWLARQLSCPAYERSQHARARIQGKGNINTPMELAIHAIYRTAKLQKIGVHAEERFRDVQTECRNYTSANGIDKPDVVAWKGPYLR